MNIETLNQLFAAQLETNSKILYFIAESDEHIEIRKIDKIDLGSLIGSWEVSKNPSEQAMPRLTKIQ